MNGRFSSGPAWLMDGDFGWRGRLGLVHPSRGWTPDHEWPRMLPRGVAFLVTRMPLKATTPEELLKMGEHAIEAALLLASASVDIICYGCTVETVLQGIEYDKRLTQELEEATGIRAKTMAGAVVEALHEFGAHKLTIVTPYIEEINKREKVFMESIGFEVIYEKGLGISETIEIAKVPPATVYKLGREAISKAPDADILFISCGNLRTIEVLSALETDTGKPTISSNQALLWAALKALGVNEPIYGFGSLLERPR
ncbi:MAG: maleate cis-trans isomerase [candidate division WOR-3 bacterium]